jgi:hypothetical protein
VYVSGEGVWDLDIGDGKLRSVSDVDVLSRMLAAGSLDLVKGLLGRLCGEQTVAIEHLM